MLLLSIAIMFFGLEETTQSKNLQPQTVFTGSQIAKRLVRAGVPVDLIKCLSDTKIFSAQKMNIDEGLMPKGAGILLVCDGRFTSHDRLLHRYFEHLRGWRVITPEKGNYGTWEYESQEAWFLETRQLRAGSHGHLFDDILTIDANAWMDSVNAGKRAPLFPLSGEPDIPFEVEIVVKKGS